MVSWFMPLVIYDYDLVYSSKIFSWTQEDMYLPENTIRGGTGYYGKDKELSEEIEHVMPDYSLYPVFKASIGFTTRGCVRSCPWCVVPAKEGKIRPHAKIKEFLRPNCRDVVLMDNNILAHPHGLSQLEYAVNNNLRIDCNQGLDAGIIADNLDIAKLLSKIHWLKGIRMACDQKSQIPAIEKAVSSIRQFSGKKGNFFCYVLVKDIEDALERVEFLRCLGVDPFAQPYRKRDSHENPAKELRAFARWVNHKAIFKTVSWENYYYKIRENNVTSPD